MNPYAVKQGDYPQNADWITAWVYRWLAGNSTTPGHGKGFIERADGTSSVKRRGFEDSSPTPVQPRPSKCALSPRYGRAIPFDGTRRLLVLTD
jgi:hypothetical protein